MIDGRYRVIERIGKGASAHVYLAEEPGADGRRVALKVFHSARDAELCQLDLLQSLEQPNLVRLLGHGTLPGDGGPYLAFEWVEGADLLEAARLLPYGALRVLLIQLCEGLTYLHERGIVHGDLKPSNLLVTRASYDGGEALALKILDSGLARVIGSSDDQGGTLVYAAPELLRGEKADGRADLYALGVLLYQVLTGALPFDSSDPAAVLRGHLEEVPRPIDPERTAAPADLAGWTARLLMKDPDDRFASAAELAELLSGSTAEPAAAPSPLPSASEVQNPVLVGRAAQVKDLESFLAGHPQGQEGAAMALILGEGGIGKTRLLAELVEMARRRQLAVHQGSCHETGGAPFGAFLELLEWAASAAETDELRCTPTDESPDVSLVDRFGPEVVKVVPRAFHRREVQPSPELQPRYERVRLIDAVGTFLLEVSRARPLLLTIEDLHWADDASADLVEYLLRNRGRGRLALAAAARPGENRADWLKETLERQTGSGSILRLPLERLDQADVGEMIRSALSLPEPPVDLAAHLLAETAGNPFFVVEMLRDLVEDGVLDRDEGQWRWNEAVLRRRRRPASLAQALERRIARASEHERRLLQALALLDRAVGLDLLATVSEAAPPSSAPQAGESDALQPTDWQPHLERLLDRGLVVRLGEDPTSRFAVAHDATRELVEREMGWEARRSIHLAAGNALEELHGEGAEDAIERIAYHFIQAGDDERPARYCMQAARKARRLYANEEASYFFLQALKYYPDPDDPVRWDALGSLGEVYILQGKMAQARTRYEEMKAIVEAAGKQPDATARAYIGLATVCRCLSEFSEQNEYAQTAFRIALKAGLLTRKAEAIRLIGLAHFNRGQLDKASRCYSVALDYLRTAGDSHHLSRILNDVGLALMSRGRMEPARELFEEALALAEVHHPNLRPTLYNNLGCVAENEGYYSKALMQYEKAEGIGRTTGNRHGNAIAVLNQACVFLRLNCLHKAEERTRRALRLTVELGDRVLQCHLTVFLAAIHRIRKEYQDAESFVAEAIENAKKIGHLEVHLVADLEQARLMLDLGRNDQAIVLAASAWKKATENQFPETAAHSAGVAAEACRRSGQNEQVDTYLARVWAALDGTAYPEAAWRAHLTAGRWCEDHGQHDLSAAHYQAGAALLAQISGWIEADELRESFLREPLRLELRVKATRLTRGLHRATPTEHAILGRPPHDWIVSLARMSESLFGLDTSDEVAQVLLETAFPLLHTETGMVLFRNPSGNPRVAAVLNAGTREFVGDCPILEQAWAGNTCSSNGHRFDKVSPITGENKNFRSAAAVPIPGPMGVQGVIYMEASTWHVFEPRELRLLEAIAGQASLALASTKEDVADCSPSSQAESFGGMVAQNHLMKDAFKRLRKLAESQTPILVEGESGTGKELAARALHSASSRASGPFVALDCGAIPDNLAESELFGCQRGAFSGADVGRQGLVGAAHGGTLFLDEVGNMPSSLQAKFLRVLQTGEIRPLGGTGTQKVDFRVVAATNEDLARAVRAGRFRQDLYYRIAGLTVHLPPLRDRPDDLPVLVKHVLETICSENGLTDLRLSRGAMLRLKAHPWNGNVRELKNVLEAARVVASSQVIRCQDLPAYLHGKKGANRQRPSSHQADLERLLAALQMTQGDKTAASRVLGWSRMRVYRVLKRANARDFTVESTAY